MQMSSTFRSGRIAELSVFSSSGRRRLLYDARPSLTALRHTSLLAYSSTLTSDFCKRLSVAMIPS